MFRVFGGVHSVFLELKVQGAGCRVQGVGYRVQGLEFRAHLKFPDSGL